MKGKFITFEGPEGSGKTSVIKGVVAHYENLGHKVITTREPGGIKIAEDIRDVILNKENTEMDAHAEALLFAASRSQHFSEKIIPALEEGCIILCDRFIDSSLAYQGHARGLGIEEVYQINKFAIGNNLPELTIFIDVPPSVGLNRVFSNTRKVDRLDLEDISFHELVYQGYKILTDLYPERIKTIDGTKKIEEVTEAAIKTIDEIL